MSYVYLLSVYGEYGSQDVTATCDRGKLASMVEPNWSEARPEWIEEAKAGLLEHLEKSDEELAADSPLNCTDGWGGMQLHVVELK